jgi:ADP-heptose:LPS heptosyltransferase
VGVLICLFISIVHGIGKIFIKPRLLKNPKNILFIQLSEMGSMVLAYSMFKKTKELFPKAKLHFLTFNENRHAIDILGVIPERNVMTVSSRNLFSFVFTSIGAIWKLRLMKISVAVDMELFARSTAILSFMSGAKNRVGYFRYHNEGLYRGNFLTHRVEFNPHIHMAQNFLNLIYAVRSSSKDVPLTKKPLNEQDIVLPKVKISETAKMRMIKRLQDENKYIVHAKKIILINPSASDIVPMRRWPLTSYIELARLLVKHEGVYVIITGVQSEKKHADILHQTLRSMRCLNMAGETSFSELLSLYEIADILITNDSGPVHFSTMTNIKTFAFFGPETPVLYGPLGPNCFVFYSDYSCSPCISAFNQRKSPCNDNKCLKTITAPEVYRKVKLLLA